MLRARDLGEPPSFNQLQNNDSLLLDREPGDHTSERLCDVGSVVASRSLLKPPGVERNHLCGPNLLATMLVDQASLRDRVQPSECGSGLRCLFETGNGLGEHRLGQVFRVLTAVRSPPHIPVDTRVVATMSSLRAIGHTLYIADQSKT